MTIKKTAVYTATRNLYPVLKPSINSLLHNSSVDEVWLLIEDARPPYPLPRNVIPMDVSDQMWFRPDGPNYRKQWTYMVLMKTALPRYFPERERLLVLDVDTIVVRNIDELWDIDMAGKCFAMARDHGRPGEYFNGGVMVQNVNELRQSGMCDKLVHALNTKNFDFCEQEAISQICAGKILTLPPEYNDSDWTGHTTEPRIVHYAAHRNWFNEPLVQEWYRKDWPDKAKDKR